VNSDREQRSKAIELELEGYRQRGDVRRQSIEFRGESLPLEVVRISVNVPLLNHDNSRLRAQLSGYPGKNTVLESPGSPEAQEILASLLRDTPQYKELCDQLEDMGQVEPGVITRAGMLVDGNTRLAALRDIGASAIDVAVLPLEASDADFFDVEMSIQLRKLVHRDYTYTNLLLLVKSLTERFDSNEAIFSALGWKKEREKRLSAHVRWLDLIEEIREETKFTYSFFDDKAELIKNLDDRYQALLREAPADAEELKWNRIFSLVLGLNKDEIRAIDEGFVVEEIAEHIEGTEAEEFFGPLEQQAAPSSGLDAILGEQAASENKKYDMREATRKVLKLEDGDRKKDAVYRQFKSGARAIIERRVKEEIRTQPLEYLDEIADRIAELARNLPAYFEDKQFDSGKFRFRAGKLVKSIKELDELLKQYI